MNLLWLVTCYSSMERYKNTLLVVKGHIFRAKKSISWSSFSLADV